MINNSFSAPPIQQIGYQSAGRVSPRLNYIDALRGLTMILVVYQHVYQLGDIAIDESILSFTFRLFRMPMFFFISGFIAYKSSECWTIDFYGARLRNKAKVQLIPTVVFFLLTCFWFQREPISFFLENGFHSQWFTYALFQFFAVYFSVAFISNRIKCRSLIYILMVVFSVIFYLAANKWYHLFPGGRYFIFFTCGIICRQYSNRWFKLLENDRCQTIAISSFLLLTIMFYNFPEVMGHIRGNGILPLFFLPACGIYILFGMFYKHRGFFDTGTRLVKGMCYIGRHTLDIYLLHVFFLPHISFAKGFFHGDQQIVIEFVMIMSIALAIVAMCLSLSFIIRQSKFLGHYLFAAKR